MTEVAVPVACPNDEATLGFSLQMKYPRDALPPRTDPEVLPVAAPPAEGSCEGDICQIEESPTVSPEFPHLQIASLPQWCDLRDPRLQKTPPSSPLGR
jgi:hypothetical protein